MDMADDETVPEGFHCITENVAADRLDDVLHKFRAVGFDAFPFLRVADSFIGNGPAAVFVNQEK